MTTHNTKTHSLTGGGKKWGFLDRAKLDNEIRKKRRDARGGKSAAAAATKAQAAQDKKRKAEAKRKAQSKRTGGLAKTFRDVNKGLK